MPDWTNKINAYTGSAVPASIRRCQAPAQLGRRMYTGLAVRIGIAVLSAGIRCCKALAQLDHYVLSYKALAQLGHYVLSGLGVLVWSVATSVGTRCYKALMQLWRRLYTRLAVPVGMIPVPWVRRHDGGSGLGVMADGRCERRVRCMMVRVRCLGRALTLYSVIALGICATVLVPGVAAETVTAADIERIKVQAQGEHRQRVQQLKVAHPSDLLDWLDQLARVQGDGDAQSIPAPVDKPSPVPELAPATSSVPATSSTLSAYPASAKKNSPERRVAPVAATAQARSESSRRTAPAPVATVPPAKKTSAPNYKISSHAFEKDQARYGVRIDQWMRAELRHTLTSQDRAPVRLYLSEEVRGASKSVPAGTLFVGTHSFNTRTGRLFITLSTAHLPDGEKISIRASVYDPNKNYGLAGTVLDNLKERTGHGRQVAGRTLVDGLIDQALPASGSIAASTVKAGTKAIQSTREDIVAPDSYLVVEPQAVLINVEAGF